MFKGAAGCGRAEEQPAGRRARWTCNAGPEANACRGRRVGTGARLRYVVRAFVMAHPSAPDAVLALDETAFLKKGSMPAGAAPQYAGITGQTENCRVAVLLAVGVHMNRGRTPTLTYVTPAGRRCSR
ncbi:MULTISPECIES: transposase [Streptomyces]|uniref:transposase n=1 Tax=Streptomyces TaxID=1883 RepID=UPI00345B81CA